MSKKQKPTQVELAIASQPKGHGFRPSFHALWHLKELKVIDDLTSFNSSAWGEVENLEKPPVIVVMDTPLDDTHPNLDKAIDLARMRDFSIFNNGAFPIPTSKLLDDEQKKGRTDLMDLGDEIWIGSEQGNVIKSEIGDESDLPARTALTRQVPGAHGTAVAGLIAGRPKQECVIEPAYLGETVQQSDPRDVLLPYAGINPFATIVPVTLSAAPYPDMVLGALDYIERINPDVVVIAAAWADDADRLGKSAPDDDSMPFQQNEVSGDTSTKEEAELDCVIWKAVEAKLKSISRNSIVLCAAGNMDSRNLAFPARLSALDDNEIIAVTACDIEGEELSYAPRLELNPDCRMIKTLSTQLPRNDSGETVTDQFAAVLPELQQRPDDGHKQVGARDIISLDPSGLQGYNPTEHPGYMGSAYLEIGSLFARFSGTSAATAVAAGLVSLAVRPGEKLDLSKIKRNELFDMSQVQLLIG